MVHQVYKIEKPKFKVRWLYMKYCQKEILFVISVKKKTNEHKCLRYFKGSKSFKNKTNMYIFTLTNLRGNAVFRYCILKP